MEQKQARFMGAELPRYLDVAAMLQEEIGALAPNSLLPTEQQLAKRFGVSRITVRGALDLLERNGSVTRLRGRGTVVSPEKVTRHFSPLTSFEQDMESQGLAFTTEILSYEPRAEAPDYIHERLSLPPSGKVGCLSLLRLVDDRIVSHELRHYPPAIANRLEPERLVEEGTSEVLESIAGRQITDVDWESEIVAAPTEVSKVLGISPRTLVLSNIYCWHLDDGTAGEAGLITYRVDRCKFRFETLFQHKNTGGPP